MPKSRFYIVETNTTEKGHPKGLYLLFATEMAERFSYYGMRAIFTLFLVKALLWTKEQASDLYGNYTGLVYLTPLLGGYLSDNFWGNRKSIIIGGLMMAIGQFLMFASGLIYENPGTAVPIMYLGLAALILGNGFFKPNISTMVGSLYREGDSRRDSAFTIFYMGINLGAFFSPLVCGSLGDTGNPADFKWGFLTAGLGMLVSLGVFIALKDQYIKGPDGTPVGLPPASKAKGEGGAAKAPLTKQEKERIAVIFILSFFVIFFWAAFEQAGASLTFFAEEQTDRNLFGKVIPASFFQSINALAIFIFAPLFAWLWTKLNKAGLEPSSPLKMAIGLFLLSMGYLIIAFGVKGIEPGVKVSMLWLVTMYLMHTFGELSLSPIGLSMVTKLSPPQFGSLLMGVWFLSTALANKFAGVLSSYYPEAGKAFPVFLGYEIDSLYAFFMLFMTMSLIASGVLFLSYKKLLQMMHGVQ